MLLKIGDTAPDFTLPSETGEKVTLSKLRGRNVVLVFYPLDFSPICTTELKSIAAHRAKYDAADAVVLGISVDSEFAHAAWKKAEGLTATLLADFHPKGAVAKAYGVWFESEGFANRGTFVIDRTGVIRAVHVTDPDTARDEAPWFEALARCPA